MRRAGLPRRRGARHAEHMSDLLSRRGFAKLALAAGAGLCLPIRVSAQDVLRMASRIEVHPSANRLAVDLFLTQNGAVGIELVPDVIHLNGELVLGSARHTLALRIEFARPEPMTRMLPRPQPVLLPSNREQRFGRYSGPIPAGLRGSGTLSVQTVLDAEAALVPPASRAALTALGQVRAQTRVTMGA